MWLMAKSEIERIEGIMNRVKVDAATIEAYKKDFESREPDELNIVDGVAQIEIRGVLTKKKNPVLGWYGIENTAYTGIQNQVAQAVQKGAKKIEFRVDSGGGNVIGMYDAMEAISNADIEKSVVVEGMAASAAYMLASQGGPITAENPLTLVGSVGVVTTMLNVPYIKEITNRKSEAKRPDINTEEGVGQVKDELDDIYNVVAERIASGRGISVDEVNEKYGKGAVMTARTALKNGMIDAIGIEDKNNAGDTANNKQGVMKMDKQQLKSEHPELFAAVMAEGIEAGKAECLEVVEGHLALAEASGDMERAVADIKGMNPVTSAVMAHHTAAGIRKAQIDARTQDAPPAVGGGTGDPAPTPADPFAKEKEELVALAEEAGAEVEFN